MNSEAFVSESRYVTFFFKFIFIFAQKKKASLSSPAEDESSREVFGRIKKLNVAPENKKRVKTQSSFRLNSFLFLRVIGSDW